LKEAGNILGGDAPRGHKLAVHNIKLGIAGKSLYMLYHAGEFLGVVGKDGGHYADFAHTEIVSTGGVGCQGFFTEN
jgi:hypothetical protein